MIKVISVSLIIWLAIASTVPALGQTRGVDAVASPSTLMVGESGQFTIRFVNLQPPAQMIAPAVAGLQFGQQSSTARRFEIVNGRRSESIELSWSFRTVREGTFVVPERTLRIDNESFTIPAVTIRVIPKSEEARTRALMVLELNQRDFFVGEVIAANLHLLVRRDMNIAGVEFARTETNAFTITGLNENPQRGTTRHQGHAYNTFSWNVFITPIRAGSMPLQFQQNITLQFAEPDAQRTSIFGFGRTRNESYSLTTDALSLNILPVPTQNRPPSFFSAIGEFDAQLNWSSKQLVAGEPVTLVLEISGTGNFDRIAAPPLPEDWDDWRTYPPRTTFTPREGSPVTGTKRFEYILIPESEEITTLPDWQFSFFDPESVRFITIDFPGSPVSVSPPRGPQGSAILFGRNDASGDTTPRGLLPLRPHPGTLLPTSHLVPLTPAFWFGNGMMALLLGAAWIREWRQSQRRSNSLLLRKEFGDRKIRTALQDAADALAKQDVNAFFSAARAALQVRISQFDANVTEPASLVASDCEHILNQTNIADSTRTQTMALFHTADSVHFAGQSPSTEDAQRSFDQLKQLLLELNHPTAKQ